jgi:phenylpropionate dioxygenase-like ring-hydroxylating dioxygenase large terminal subunit
LLFAGPGNPLEELADFGCSEDFDFSGYVLDRVETTDYATNWKTFVEVYLEVYHVDFLHAGLGNFANCDDFHVRYGKSNSVQVMTAKKGLTAPGTPVYRRWQEACLKQLRGKTPKYGALWATSFPGLTLEWYPNVLIVSNLIPRSPALTTNVVEFYYPEEIVHFERDFIDAQQAAYNETALEDDEICRRLDRGRRALWEQGRDDAGPYQSPMEDTMVHFHEWYRHEMERT